jgi:hypothetical protein
MTQEELYQFIDRDRLEYMERQRDLFDGAKPALLEKYLNQYIAFEDGQVLDSDADRQKLAERIYGKYGCRDFLMKQVTVEERVYYVGGFRTIRKPVS